MADDIKVILEETDSQTNKTIVPFIVSGNLNSYDSDMSYSLCIDPEVEYKFREVVQKPIDPAYKCIIEKMKTTSLNKHGAICVDPQSSSDKTEECKDTEEV